MAIAITLLALGLPLPAGLNPDSTSGQVFSALWKSHDDYLAFLISFVVIANYWRSHHRLYRNVDKLDSRIVTLNFLWLLMIVVIPFATRLISADGGFGARFTVYAVIQVLTMLAFLLMSRHIRDQQAAPARDPNAGDRRRRCGPARAGGNVRDLDPGRFRQPVGFPLLGLRAVRCQDGAAAPHSGLALAGSLSPARCGRAGR